MNRYLLDKERLQKYLPQLRACAGFSVEVLAAKVGLTKQAISFMENHLDKSLTKLQYLGIRSVFDEEIYNHQDNINLRDCYDLVFSDPNFYKENKDRIEYAIYQAVEDTKRQIKKNRADAKKNGLKSKIQLITATEATLAVGGVAAATFPMAFPLLPLGMSALLLKDTMKKINKNSQNIQPKQNRASEKLFHPKWMSEVINSNEHDSLEE